MKTGTKKLIIAVILLIAAALACVGAVLATSGIILLSNTEFNVSTISFTASTEFSYNESTTTEISFTKPGDSETINVKTTNETTSVLRCYYTLSATKDDDGNTTTFDSTLASATLVYCNGNYIGTLAEVLGTTYTSKNIDGSYVAEATYTDGACTNSPDVTDTFTFELHNGADNSIYDGKTIGLTITAYTETADYEKYIFVESSDDLTAAVNDINSGLLTSGTKVILLGDAAFSDNAIKNPMNIELNGHTLSGSVTLYDTAYLWCSGSGVTSATTDDNGTTTNGVSVTLTSYDETTLKAKLIAAAEKALSDGIKSGGTAQLFGVNSYYATATGITITATKNNYTYADGTITANSTTRTQVEKITVCGKEIEFKILGKEYSAINDYLAHIPKNGTTEVTYDLFLPTSIKSIGATIEWTSSNEKVVDNAGKIVGDAESATITLYAKITVNGKTTTQSFTFKVSAHTEELNFYNFVANMSPIIIYETKGTTETDGTTTETGVYNLPVVDSGNTYDYRKPYTTPSASSFSSTDYGTHRYSYSAFNDIGLTELTYSYYYTYTDSSDNAVYTTDVTEVDEGTYSYTDASGNTYTCTRAYSYLTCKNNTVYLSQATMDSYAKICVTGKFSSGQTYSADVVIIISVGNDTTIYDETLSQIDEDLKSVNLLKAMLETRVANGVAGEEAYFYARAEFTSKSDSVFTITYNTTADSGITIPKTPESYTDSEGKTYYAYKITVDPTIFSSTETSASITVNVTWSGSSSSTRTSTYYFTLPAAVHTSDFDGDSSLFNSIKAQVIQQLPEDETKKGTGFNDVYTINYTGDYILIRDIVGDEEYKNSYYTLKEDDYLATGTTTLTAHAGCTELWIYTEGDTTVSGSTDAAARDFAALIAWATGSGTETVSALNLTNTDYVVDTTVANGKEYLDDTEIAVLKAYYTAATSSNSSAESWETLWKSVSEEKAGYVFTKSTDVEGVAANYVGNEDNASTSYALKYNSILQWATNFRDNEYNPSDMPAVYITGITPAPEQINVELASVTYTGTAPEEGTDKITVTETRVYLGGTTKNSYITKKDDHTYTCFYVDSTNQRAWYYVEKKLEGTKNTANDHKYNCKTVTSTLESLTIEGEAASLDGYTLDDASITSYLDDDTEYITPGEASVLFAFWLKYNGTLNTGRAAAYIKAFFEDTTIPTYFTTDGVKTLMSAFYTNAGIKIGAADSTEATPSFTASSHSTTSTTQSGATASITDASNAAYTIKVSYAPAVASAEALPDAISYFKNLTLVYVQGTKSRSAFLSTYALSMADAHLRNNCSTSLTTYVLEYAANAPVEFDLSEIYSYSALKQIDVSYNSGITNISPLVNSVSDNYTYVNITNLSSISSTSSAYKYVWQNSGENATVYYTYNGRAETKTGTGSGSLSYLSDFTQLLSEYEYALTEVDGDDIYYRIESGNEVITVEASATEEIDTASEMQELLSPYYYCTSNFTYGGTTYAAGTVLQFAYSSGGTCSVYETIMKNVAEDETDIDASTATPKATSTGVSTTTELIARDSEGNNSASSTAKTTKYTVDGVTFDCIRLRNAEDGNPGSYALWLTNYIHTTDTAVATSKTYYARSGSEGSYTYEEVEEPSQTYVTTYYECTVSYTLTTDTEVDSTKTYYTRSGSEGSYTYKVVSEPKKNKLTKYYECTKTYALTTDTVLATSKTYYTYDSENKKYNQVTNPTSEDIATYYEYYETYTKTTDSTVDASKTYYTRSGSKGSYTYENVKNPSDTDISDYYEKDEISITTTTDFSDFGTLACIFIGSNTDQTSITSNESDLLGYLKETKTSGTIGTTISDLSTIGADEWLSDCYIYFPETGYTITYTNSTLSAVKVEKVEKDSTKNSLSDFGFQSVYYQYRSDKKFRLSFDGSESNTLKVGEGNITVASKANGYYDQVEEADLTVTYSNSYTGDKPDTKSVIAFGVDIVATQTLATTVTAYYYDSSSNSVKSATYTLSSGNNVVSTSYMYRFWCIKSGSTEKTYIDGATQVAVGETTTITVSDIASALKTKLGLSYDLGDPTDYTWTVYDDKSRWTIDTTITATDETTYISYVPTATTSNINNQLSYIGTYVEYTGSTNGETYYVSGTEKTAYYGNKVYEMSVKDSTLVWSAATTNSVSMEKVLLEANSHFGDKYYGEWYGMYVAYMGTSSGGYTNGTIYRIMPNAENTAFVYITANTVDSTNIAYYYCTEDFSYNDNDFTKGTVYKVTFSSGAVTNVETCLANVENEVTEVEHTGTDGGYEKGTTEEITDSSTTYDITSDMTTLSGTTLTYNYFILTNGSTTANAMFASASSSKISSIKMETGVTYNDNNWSTLDPCKVSFLTEEEYGMVLGATTKTTVGVSAISNLNCSTLTYENSVWSISGSPTAYYLYFPKLGLFAGSVSSTSGTTVTASQKEGAAYYICYYATTGTYFFYTATDTSDVTSLMTLGMSGSVACLNSSEFNKACSWTIKNSGTVYTSINAYGTYTGDTTEKSLKITITYSDSESTTATATATGLAYTVTKKASGNATPYKKTVYAYSGGKVYSVTYSYTEIDKYEKGTVTYYDGSGDELVTSEYVENVLTYYYNSNTVSKISYTLDGVEYIIYSSTSYTASSTVQAAIFGPTKSDLAEITTTSYQDNDIDMADTGYSSVNIISDGVQFASDFGMDYGTYYDNDYTLSSVMFNIAANSWTINGTKCSNADMEGRIIYIAKSGAGSDSFVKTGLYMIVYSEAMGSYSIKSLMTIDYKYNSGYSLGKFFNGRTFTVLQGHYEYTTNDKLGTGGTYSAEVTAFTHEKIKVTASGTDTDSDGIFEYTDGNGNTAYYKEVTATDDSGTSTTTYYKTDSEGNYIYEDNTRPYTVEVVG